MNRVLALVPGALALAAPQAPAHAETLLVPLCGDPAQTVAIPIDRAPDPAGDHQCCHGIACHAAWERKPQRKPPLRA